jgi:RHS repeat-associated protein
MLTLRWKAFVVFAFCVLSLFALQTPARAQVWPNGYSYRRTVTIDHTKVPNTDQTNFPVLFSGTYPDFATTSNGGAVTSSNGYDIIFTSDAAGATALPYERESYSATTGAFIFWVQIPSLSHTTDPVVYLFYGNSSITTDQSNKNGVWDTNYKGVWHFSNGSTLSGLDSTADGFALTNTNSVGATSGKIDGAASFNGSNNYLYNSSLSIPQGSSITISFWKYLTSGMVQNSAAFTIGNSSDPNRISAHAPWSDSVLYWDYGTYNGGGRVSTSYSSYLGSWTYVSLEYDASSTLHSIYLNGALAVSNASSNTPQATETGIYIGYWPYYGLYDHANVDEFRVSTLARSADWVAAEYNNQSSPATFYTVSAETPANPPTISSLSPTSGEVGLSVTISGTNFGTYQGPSTVTFGGVAANATSWTPTQILATVPNGAVSGNVVVTVAGAASNAVQFTVSSSGPVWSNGYSYQRPITISHTKVPNSDQSNFPVLISGTYAYLATIANGGNVTNGNGYDILFSSDPYGLNVLPFEQESYNASTGAIIYWVQVPTVSHTTDTVIYMFYGNSSVTTDQSNKNGVWDSNYLGVWHLDETSGLQQDSTANGNSATAGHVTAEGSETAQIGRSDQFNAANPDHVDLPNIALTSAFTLEAWIYPTAYADWARVLAKAYSSNTAPYIDYDLAFDSASSHKIDVGFDQNGTGVGLSSNGTIPLNQWTHVVGTYDGSNLRLFLNGASDNSVAASGSVASVSQTTEIGYNNVYGPQSFTGNIDEVRISTIARSADWIATEYNNQTSLNTFYSIGLSAPYNGPNISSLSPTSGGIGTWVTITGTNFGSSQGSSTITFGGAAATVMNWESTEILAIVPNAAISGNVVVTVSSQPSNGVPFTVTGGGVWSNGYGYRRTITINHTKVPNTDQKNFPMLFSGTYAYLATTSNGGAVTNANGYDIAFTLDAAGTIPLPFEKDSYNPSTGAVSYWVQIPTLSHTSDTVVFLFFGNSSITTDQSNKNGTWDSKYEGVWHLSNGTTLTATDSTSDANNGTISGPTATAGFFDGGANFVHYNSQYIATADSSSLKPANLTVSFWMNRSGPQEQYAHTIQKGQGSGAPYGSYLFQLNDSGSDSSEGTFSIGTTDNVPNGVVYPSGSFSGGVWYYIVGTFNSATGVVSAYKNGQLIGTKTAAVGTISYDTTGLQFGRQPTYNQYFNGVLDEVRIENVARSADWIAAEYTNQSSPWAFYDEGGPAILSLSPNSGYFGTSVTITGRHFGATQGPSFVTFNGLLANVTSWSDSTLVVTVPPGATSGNVVVTVSQDTTNGMSFTVFPPSWSDLDIGTVGIAGTATYGNDKFTVSGDGSQLWNTADAFNFAYQSLSGDGTIIARLRSLQGTSGLQGAGVMIRETPTAGSTYAAVDYTNIGNGDWVPNFIYRTSTGGSTSSQNGGVTALPLWIKVARSGSTFTAYTSTDCVDWTQLGTSITISMASNVYIGLFVNSGDSTTLGIATFDNVSVSQNSSPAPIITSMSATTGSVGSQVVIGGSGFGATQGSSVVLLNGSVVMINSWSATSITITIPSGATSGYLVVSVAPSMDSNPLFFEVTSQSLPSPWLDSDVGQVTLTGSATYSGGTFTVKGEGVGLGNTVDGFHFVYQALSGDGSIVARIASFSAASNSALAGVMIRETLTESSTHADEVRANDGGGYYYCYFMNRPTTGGSSNNQWQQGPSAFNPPIWVKITRSGNTFTGYTSSDGVYWTQNGTSQTISMATNVYIGLTTGSGTIGVVATATFDNVTMAAGSPATTPVITNVSPTSGGIGAQVTVTGQLFGASQGTSNVYFNGAGATSISSWGNTQIVTSVPSSASTGPITVVVNGIGSNRDFTFTFYNPVISNLQPPAAPAGGYITINGSGFGAYQGSSTVQFNAVAASVSSWSDTSIRVQVPSNATSGSVTVTVGGIVSGAAQFTLIEALSITSISPASGEIGATVTISGTGFGPTQSNSILSLYGATVTNITSWSDTSIVGVVPLGISTGSVSVGVAGATMYGPVFTLTSKVTIQDSQGNTSVYTSEVVGGEWRLTDSQGSGCSTCTPRGLVHRSYDPVGNVLSTKDPLGNITTNTYDAANDLLSQTAPVDSTHNATTSYTYNSLGEVLTVSDALENVTTNGYNANGNLTSVTTPAPNGNTAASVTQFAYNTLGELTTITDPLNHVTTITYTTAGLVATITDAQNHVTTYGYDAHGNRTSVKDANNQTTTFSFDSGDRLKTITYPDNSTISFTYDNRGRRTSVTDQNNKTTTYAYDDANRITSVTDPATHTTTYAYDTEDNLGTLTDANTHSTFFSYDAFDRVTNANFPSSLSETYAYDANSNLTSKTDRKGQTITYVYDDLNRLTSKTYPDTTSVAYIYDLVGKVLQVNDPTGTYAFAYDNMGRLIGTTTSYSFLGSRNFTTSYSYDAASNRTGFTDPEGGTTGYTYDTLNRLATLAPPTAFGSGSFGFSYDALSRRTQMTRPNNITTNYSYDNLSRLLSVLHQAGSSTIDGASYGLDNAGNRTSKTDWLANVTSNYNYDALYELTQVTQGSNTTESYSYDPVGNRLSSLGVSPYSYNNSNELSSTPNASYSYDNNGNLVSKTDSTGTTTYAWDFENRLTTVTLPASGGTITFKYDPFGRRVYKLSSLSTSIFAYDGNNLIEEATSSGAVVARYAQTQSIDEPLAMLRGGTTSYYEADGLGSVTSLSSAAGALAQTYTFDSFGKQTASSGSLTNPFRYTGRELDAETNLHYYRARYYDPTSGRFISEDPIRFYGGIDFYSYSANRPMDFSDPLGLKCITRIMLVTAYNDLGPGKDWNYYKPHDGGDVGSVGPGTVAVANANPQPYPFGSTVTVYDYDGQSVLYNGEVHDTGAGWNKKHHDVLPDAWIDIWLPGRKANEWGTKYTWVKICYDSGC